MKTILATLLCLAAVVASPLLVGCASDSRKSETKPAATIQPETSLAHPPHPSSPSTLSEPPPARYYLDDGPPDDRDINLAAIPDAVPKREPVHPARNLPYRAFGKIYRPHAAPRPHRETGVASWYGRRYHGRETASGEIYDMFKMTAAHPVLPIPSYARVTRADNRESVVVRINDRGPFLRGRVIDLSYVAAAKLGIAETGSAKVIVESLPPEGEEFKSETNSATVSDSDSVLNSEADSDSDSETVAENSPSSRGVFIQLGAFSKRLGAEKMLADFRSAAPEKFRGLGKVVYDSLSTLHRMGVGNYPSLESARDDLRALCDAGLCGFVAPLP